MRIFDCLKIQLFWSSYWLINLIALPFAVLRLLWKSRKNPAYRERIAQRFACALPPINTQPPTNIQPIWIHAVSVGEFLAVYPLILALLEKSEQKILITTTTPTGAKMVVEKLGEYLNQRIFHSYFPFDFHPLMTRFINKINPKSAFFVETEIWPSCLKILHKRAIPVYLINARLSEKSYRRYAKLGKVTAEILNLFTLIACQNQQTQRRFNALAGNITTKNTVNNNANNTANYGSLKFDISIPTHVSEKQKNYQMLLKDQPYLLAASTHRGEDALLIEAYLNTTCYQQGNGLLIIAPRHPERADEVLQLCAEKSLVAERLTDCVNRLNSQPNMISSLDVLVIDTLGDLLIFYASAKAAIIGGSFIPHGGHNPLEPALFKIPTIIGPHYFNFETIVTEMLGEKAIKVCEVEKLTQCIDEVLQVNDLGINAHQYLKKHQGALSRYLDLITSH